MSPQTTGGKKPCRAFRKMFFQKSDDLGGIGFMKIKVPGIKSELITESEENIGYYNTCKGGYKDTRIEISSCFFSKATQRIA